jgi:plastocyanin
VVHRALRQRRRLGLGVLALLLACLVFGAATASAANRRISIGHYQWSSPQIHLDLGEHVTWYWVGPDLLHSVTGTSANDAGWDSDPGLNTPQHDLGDTYQLTFNQPGTYTFQCKLHAGVRGSVIVSDKPGDPNKEVDPVPKVNIDDTPPHLNGVKLSSNEFGRKGTTLQWGTNEKKTKLDAEYYRVHKGHRGGFAGWDDWNGHVGYNDSTFGGKSKHFDAKPGRYMAILQASDKSGNHGKKRTRRFKIS